MKKLSYNNQTSVYLQETVKELFFETEIINMAKYSWHDLTAERNMIGMKG